MATPAGRIARIVVGIAIILLGIALGGPAGWILGLVGLVPIAAGVTNVCLIAPLIGAPFKGSGAH